MTVSAIPQTDWQAGVRRTDETEAINEIGIVAGAGAHRSLQLIFIDKNCHSAGEPTPRGRQLS